MGTITEYTLPNGLKCIHRWLEGEVVYLAFAVKVGSRYETRETYGLAHFIEHLLFKGTLSRNSRQIIQEIEGVGGELNAFTTKEETIIYCLAPKSYTEVAVALLCDIVQNSCFPKEELDKEKGVVIDEIESYEDSPSELIYDEFENLLFKGHSLGHNILGSEKSVQSFTQETCFSFFKKYYQLDNMCFSSQGSVEDQELEYLLEKYFHPQESTASKRVAYLLDLKPLPTEHYGQSVVKRKGTHQCHILYGATAYAQDDSRRLALSLLVNILGGFGMNSRLNLSLREDRGLVYQVESSYTAYSDEGVIMIYLGCSKASRKESMLLVEEELDKLKNEMLTAEELAQAKTQLLGQMTIGRENRENVFLGMSKNFLHHNKVETFKEVKEKVEALTQAELSDVAREIFDKSRFICLIYN